MTQRDDMGWEVGGGFRIGSSYTPMADSCQCMAKTIQYCKKNKIKNKNSYMIGREEKSKVSLLSVTTPVCVIAEEVVKG